MSVNIFVNFITLIKNLKSFWRMLLLATIGIVLASSADLLIYRELVPKALDQGIIANKVEFLHYLPWLIFGCFLLRSGGDFLGTYCMGYVTRSVVKKQRIDILTHILYLPTSFFSTNHTGDIIARINYDTEQVATAILDAVLEFAKDILSIGMLLTVMFSISWRLTLVTLVLLPLIGLYLRYINVIIKQCSINIQKSIAQITNIAAEIIQNNKIIKIFAGFNIEKQKIVKASGNAYLMEIKLILIKAISDPLMQALVALTLAFLIYLAATTKLSAGLFVGFFGAVFQLVRPVKRLTNINTILSRGLVSLESINKLLLEPVEYDTGKIANLDKAYNIRFKNVSYGYTPNSYVIKDINCIVNKGQMLAIVGRSGAGKSTLISLLLRFYDCVSGNIFINDINIKDLTLSCLRQQFAVVLQESLLFNESVAHNISYGLDNMDKHQIISALTQAHALEFIKNKNDFLDYALGVNGQNLSGGERQRISLARALLRKASILILDEATSALDLQTEQCITKALQTIKEQCILLVIAHRKSTIAMADQVLVIENGSVVGLGTHSELAQSKHYIELFNDLQ